MRSINEWYSSAAEPRQANTLFLRTCGDSSPPSTIEPPSIISSNTDSFLQQTTARMVHYVPNNIPLRPRFQSGKQKSTKVFVNYDSLGAVWPLTYGARFVRDPAKAAGRNYPKFETFRNKLPEGNKAFRVSDPLSDCQWDDLIKLLVIRELEAKNGCGTFNKSLFWEEYVVIEPYDHVPSFEKFDKELNKRVNSIRTTVMQDLEKYTRIFGVSHHSQAIDESQLAVIESPSSPNRLSRLTPLKSAEMIDDALGEPHSEFPNAHIIC